MAFGTVFEIFCRSERAGKGVFESSCPSPLALFRCRLPRWVLSGGGEGVEVPEQQLKAWKGDAEPEGRAFLSNPGSSVREGPRAGGRGRPGL